MNLRKSLSLIILFVVLLALPVAGRYARFFTGAPDRSEVIRPPMGEIVVPTPPTNQVIDRPICSDGGEVLVDLGHDNQLDMAELNVLAGRLAARGSRLVPWSGEDLPKHLRTARALMVVAPLETYGEDEIQAITDFVETGGRILLVGDPTRYRYLTDPAGSIVGTDSDVGYLNQVSVGFGLAFVDDYLYNVTENEGNFRNIRLHQWGDSALTDDLVTVVFYATHSLTADDAMAVILADDNTWSSATDRAGGLVVAAEAGGGRVLALGDLTFMTGPYHTVYDNGLLISHVADFLVGGQRSYDLYDFPLLFGSQVALVFANSPDLGPGQLQLVDGLQGAFEASDRQLVLSDMVEPDRDAILVGLYSQHQPMAEYLSAHGVTLTITTTLDLSPADRGMENNHVDPAEPEPQGVVTVAGLGSYSMSGTALIILHQVDGTQIMNLLAASQEGLMSTLDRLVESDLIDCVDAGAVVLCPSGVDDEPVETEWTPIAGRTESEPGLEPESQPSPADETQGELLYGDSLTGELEAGEIHHWQFAASAGDLVRIAAEPLTEGLDLVLELQNSDGEVLSVADEGGAGAAEQILEFELPGTGRYVIAISEQQGEPGSYRLELRLASEPGVGEPTGTIDLGETVEGSLAAGEGAVWSFRGEADQAIIIIVRPDENGDILVELQDSEGDALASADDALTGEEERIEGLLPADGDYRILIEEFYGKATGYELTLEAGGGGPVLGSRGILVVSADAGEPLLTGRTGADVYVNLLSSDYNVTLWSLSTDGELDTEMMQGYQLLIWASGDYVGDLESLAPMLYFSEGNAVLMSGVSLGLLSDGEMALLRDLRVSDRPSPLTARFSADQLFELTAEIEAPVFAYEAADDDGTLPVFLRGPASQEAGDVIAAAFQEPNLGQARLMLIGFPIYLLPEEAQGQLIDNAVNWFGVDLAR
jgi:hypothetical protein